MRKWLIKKLKAVTIKKFNKTKKEYEDKLYDLKYELLFYKYGHSGCSTNGLIEGFKKEKEEIEKNKIKKGK